MQFTDWFCRHKVCVLYAERLVTGTALFVNLHHEQFVIRQGELGQHEYVTYRGFSVHRCQTVVCPYRFYEVLLHGRALGHLLVDNFETDVVDVERYIRTVAQGSMQVQQVIVDIKPFEQCLYAVLLATDMPDIPFVLFIQRVHNTVHHQRCLPAEFFQLHEHAVARNPAFGIVPGASLPSRWKARPVRPYKPH